MSGRNIEGLQLPPQGYDPARKKGEKSLWGFESREAAEREDRIRIAMLRRAAARTTNFYDPKAAERLADRLEDTLDRGRLARTPASFRYLRQVRRRLGGWLWHLHDVEPYRVSHATLLSDEWTLPADDLMLFDPVRMLRQVRDRLEAKGTSRRNGYIAMGVHGEFWNPTKEWRIHGHATVGGDMRKCVDALRGCRMFRQEPGEERERPNVLIQGKLGILPKPMLYTLQGWFPKRGYENSLTGEIERGPKTRVPEPYHTQYLLWLDRYRVKDLVLLINLRATEKGLMIIRKPA